MIKIIKTCVFKDKNNEWCHQIEYQGIEVNGIKGWSSKYKIIAILKNWFTYIVWFDWLESKYKE